MQVQSAASIRERLLFNFGFYTILYGVFVDHHSMARTFPLLYPTSFRSAFSTSEDAVPQFPACPGMQRHESGATATFSVNSGDVELDYTAASIDQRPSDMEVAASVSTDHVVVRVPADQGSLGSIHSLDVTVAPPGAEDSERALAVRT